MNYLSVIDDFVGLTDIGDLSSISERLKMLDLDRLSELCFNLWKALPTPDKQDDKYRYLGNSTLSGLPHPCGALDCRGESISTAANFAAIYANEVILFNPFEELAGAAAVCAEKKLGSQSLVREIAFHVSEVLMLRPLIDSGMCTFLDEEEENYCPDCMAKAIEILRTGSADDLKSEGIFFDLVDHYATRSTVIYEGKRGSDSVFHVQADADLTGHESTYVYRKTGRKFKKSDLNSRLNKDQILTLGIAQKFAHFAGIDLIAGSNASSKYRVDNIITSSSQLGVIREYFGSQSFSTPVDIDYPLLTQARLTDVLAFRKQEWHHFHDFRKLVEDGIRSGEDVSAQLADASAKIQAIISKNSRTLNRSILKDTAVTVAGVAATVATSGFSGIIAATVGVLSTGHLVKELIPKLIDRFGEPEALRDEKSYYAWKLRRSNLI